MNEQEGAKLEMTNIRQDLHKQPAQPFLTHF